MSRLDTVSSVSPAVLFRAGCLGMYLLLFAANLAVWQSDTIPSTTANALAMVVVLPALWWLTA